MAKFSPPTGRGSGRISNLLSQSPAPSAMGLGILDIVVYVTLQPIGEVPHPYI